MKKLLLPLLILLLASKIAFAGDLIAYSHLSKDGYWQIWVMDSGGSNQRQVTRSKMDKRDPAWLSGGTKIGYRTPNGQFFIYDLEQNQDQEVLHRYQQINNPHFCDLTGEVVFVRFKPNLLDKSELWKADLEAGEAILLTKDSRLRYQPRFSPRGDKIAFVQASDNKEHHHIWMMSADGKNFQQLTDGPGLETLPAFSPDGKSIVFTSNRGGHDYDLYVLDLESKELQQITRYSGLDSSGCFSPDGESVAFVSTRGGNQQIWVISAQGGSASGRNSNGSNARQLTFGEESVDPAWTQ